MKEQKPAEWSEKHIADIFEKVGLAKIVREQGNDALTNALQDAMLELSKVENAEWSEEDEKKVHFLSRLIEFQVKDGEYCFGEGACAISKQEAIEMLKSLRPSWKPSEEQMEALEKTIRLANFGTDEERRKALASLYEQLKAL